MIKFPGLKTGIAFFFVIFLSLSTYAVFLGDGRFIYLLDDAYIHLAISKNLVQHGVWGVMPHAFSSCSSSVLWTLLICGSMLLVGVNTYIPLVLNFIITILLIFYISRLFRKYHLPEERGPGLILFFIIISAMIPLSLSGMEHNLFALAALVFTVTAAEKISQRKTSLKEVWPLFFWAFLMVSVRYEGLFPAAVICVLLIFRKGWLSAVTLAVTAWLPVVLFGLYMLGHDQPFLPVSLLVKTKAVHKMPEGVIGYLGVRIVIQLLLPPFLAGLLIAAAVTARVQIKKFRFFWSDKTLVLIIAVSTLLLHAEFARTPCMFNRYISYLILLTLAGLTINSEPFFSEGLKTTGRYKFISRLMIGIPFLWGIWWLVAMPFAITNIYHQQYQMAEFFKTYYSGKTVAINDIGTTSYFTDVKYIDIVGLGNQKVAEAIINDTYDSEFIQTLVKAENVRIAFVYKEWAGFLFNGIPDDWIEVGEWRIPFNVVCSRPNVTIYAVDPKEKNQLVRNLKSFAEKLPKAVQQSGIYLN